MLREFRAFIAKGNVLDLAVAVIIGAAFGKIATSLTEDIIMPVIGAIFGGLDFSNYFIMLKSPPAGYTGPMTYDALTNLEAAGLVSVARHRGRSPTVTILKAAVPNDRAAA